MPSDGPAPQSIDPGSARDYHGAPSGATEWRGKQPTLNKNSLQASSSTFDGGE